MNPEAGFSQFLCFVVGAGIFLIVFFNTGQGEWSWSPKLTPEDLSRHQRYRIIAGIIGGLLALPGVIRIICAAWLGVVL